MRFAQRFEVVFHVTAAVPLIHLADAVGPCRTDLGKICASEGEEKRENSNGTGGVF